MDKNKKKFAILSIVGAVASAAVAFAGSMMESRKEAEFESIKERVALLEEKISE